MFSVFDFCKITSKAGSCTSSITTVGRYIYLGSTRQLQNTLYYCTSGSPLAVNSNLIKNFMEHSVKSVEFHVSFVERNTLYWLKTIESVLDSLKKGQCSKERECVKGEGWVGGGGSLSEHHNESALFG